MPSEVALVFFLGGHCLMQRHKKYNAQLLVMSKKLRTFARRNNSNLDSIEYQVMKSKTNKKNIMKKDEFVDLMRQQGWTAEEVKEMVEVPLCGCVRAFPTSTATTPTRRDRSRWSTYRANAGWSSSRATACATTTSTRATACW